MKTKKAFTLVELLVVIAIIALLMSILMPALAKVREQAENIRCAAHLRQQGIALYSYSVNNGKYPLPILQGFWPFGGLGWNETRLPLSLNDSRWQPAGQAALIIGKHIDDPKFFFCPAASKKYTAFGRPLTYETEWKGYYDIYGPGGTSPAVGWFAQVYTGYPYWIGYRSGQTFYDDRFKKDIAKNHLSPGTLLTVTDAICTDDPPGGFGTYFGADEHPIFASHVSRSRLQGGNVLYNDGSVSWQKMERLIADGDRAWRLRIPVPGVSVNFWFGRQ